MTAKPKGTVLAVCTSASKGERKKNIEHCRLVPDFGLDGDAHAGDWHRQVSLLATESIAKMQAKGLDVGPGDFAENLTTEGLDLCGLAIGSRLKLLSGAILEITQIGKICHDRCAIFYQAGDCVMPREGVFAKVVEGGSVACGDQIEIIYQPVEG